MDAIPGDKVLIKSSGKRAIIQSTDRAIVIVKDQDDGTHSLLHSEIVNYSLAARKAWKKMPGRRVGRPVGTKRSNKVSVTLRIDRELWDAFVAAEKQKLIENRTTVINELIRQKLHEHQVPFKKRGG